MLRVYFLLSWFKLSDPSVEEALYKSPMLRQFAGVDFGLAALADKKAICWFRHLLEKRELGGAMLGRVNEHLATKGIRVATGTIVDATILHVHSSTKSVTRRSVRRAKASTGASG